MKFIFNLQYVADYNCSTVRVLLYIVLHRQKITPNYTTKIMYNVELKKREVNMGMGFADPNDSSYNTSLPL